jgi:hypothetical protein
MREHVDCIEQQLDEHAANESLVSLSLPDEIYLRSFTWAREELGCTPATDGAETRDNRRS